jgi:AcrR family transcriptional regulator
MKRGVEPALKLQRGERHARLMTAAREVFIQRGYQDATTAEIAQRAGVVESNIYHYFASKRDLLIRVLEAWYADTLPDYSRFMADYKGAASRLRFLIRHHLRVIHDHPALYRLIVEVRGDRNYRASKIHEMNRRYSAAVLEVIEDGVLTGELRADAQAPLVRDLIFAAIEYLVRPYVEGRGTLSPDELADRILDHAYRGVAAPAREANPAEGVIDRLEAAVARLERLPDADGRAPAPRPPRNEIGGSAEG